LSVDPTINVSTPAGKIAATHGVLIVFPRPAQKKYELNFHFLKNEMVPQSEGVFVPFVWINCCHKDE